MSKTSATHSGHCQACGRLQKLPKGTLAKHGYNVAHGFFSGVCCGSGSLPFEQSCALVKQFIASAQSELDSLLEHVAALNAPATSDVAWVHVSYAPKQYGYRNEHVWEEKQITMTTEQRGEYAYHTFTYVGGTHRDRATNQVVKSEQPHNALQYDYETKTLLDACTKLNRKYATYLQHEITNLQRYMAWQTERVNTWKEMPLLPVDAKKDKQGFQPTATAY